MKSEVRPRESLEGKGLLDETLKYPNEEGTWAKGRPSSLRSIFFWLSICLNFVFFALGSSLYFRPHTSQNANELRPQDVYSPAERAIEYKTVVYRTGLGADRTPYMGSSDEVNETWETLYNSFGLSYIDRESAMKLPNLTAPASFDTSRHIVQLDVFHQLHCLNMLRKRLYPGKYEPDTSDDGLEHAEHCVESLRQSLQCHSDVSTIFWEWSEKDGFMKGNTATTHTCKNFEKIQEWAWQHVGEQDDDFYQHTDGAPLRNE